MAAPVIVTTAAAGATGGGSGASVTMSQEENRSWLASLPTGAGVTYSVSGGADAAKFEIAIYNGAPHLRWVSPGGDFEAPGDVGTDNVYDVIISATNADGTTTQALAVTVTDVAGGPPVFVEPAIGPAGSTISIIYSQAENAAFTRSFRAVDESGAAITYTLGGTDAGLFTFDAGARTLTLAARDYETPGDQNGDNTYEATVTATSATGTARWTARVAVTDVAEGAGPAITSNAGGANASVSLAENGTAVTTVAASGGAITYALDGGVDAAKFAIDPATGVLTFAAAPDYETPTDTGANNVYDVVVKATNTNGSATQAIAVTVTNVVEGTAPAITSNGGGANGTISIAENGTAVTTAAASGGGVMAYSLNGGADAAKFAINPTTGVLTFVTPPDFEAPADAGANNVYDVVVRAANEAGSASQTLAVTITDVANETPTIIATPAQGAAGGGAGVSVTMSQPEASSWFASFPTVQGTTYSITGGADAALFVMGVFNNAPSIQFKSPGADFEAPSDQGGNNVYDVEVTATNVHGQTTQAIALTVTDRTGGPPVFVEPSISSSIINTYNQAENAVFTRTFRAVDETGAAITYSLSGVDAGLFTFDAGARTLSLSARDFEHPNDQNGDGVYEATVSATSSTGTARWTAKVQITDEAVEPPMIWTNGAGPAAAVNVWENTTFAANVKADPATPTISYSIIGGADQAKFSVSAAGVLSFNAAPDFEAPTDADLNNVYVVEVQASSANGTDSQMVSVTVVDVDENPPSGGGGGVPVFIPPGGTSGADSVAGTTGADTQAGGDGGDSLDGGAGADFLDGDGGNDVLLGGEGPDFIRGGADSDTVSGGEGPDVVNGNQGSDSVNGGTGDDTVYGGQGSDSVDGGAGDDGHVNGNVGEDVVHGGDGNDSVYGGQGSDTVHGDAGSDRISGDLGNDLLFGGAGADQFAFGRGGGQDWVGDFSGAEGDRIVVARPLTFTVGQHEGQVLITLSDGTTIGLAGVTTFNADWIVAA